MLVRTDDEVYRVDSVWLGPPRATFPWRARYVSYGVGLIVMILVIGIFIAMMLVGMLYYVWGIGGAVLIVRRRWPVAVFAVTAAASVTYYALDFPDGPGWQYEPKWDGFRGVLENDGGELALWSRKERPLLRYFPELRPLGDMLPHVRFGQVGQAPGALKPVGQRRDAQGRRTDDRFQPVGQGAADGQSAARADGPDGPWVYYETIGGGQGGIALGARLAEDPVHEHRVAQQVPPPHPVRRRSGRRVGASGRACGGGARRSAGRAQGVAASPREPAAGGFSNAAAEDGAGRQRAACRTLRTRRPEVYSTAAYSTAARP